MSLKELEAYHKALESELVALAARGREPAKEQPHSNPAFAAAINRSFDLMMASFSQLKVESERNVRLFGIQKDPQPTKLTLQARLDMEFKVKRLRDQGKALEQQIADLEQRNEQLTKEPKRGSRRARHAPE
jgi:hypothetical protein